MKSLGIDKSNIFLILIFIVVAAVAVLAWFTFREDTVQSALKQDSIVKALFVLEDGGKPLSSYVLVFYPMTRRAALFDIPTDTGGIIKSLGRTDAISALFKGSDQKLYRQEISRLMAMDIPLHISMDLQDLSNIVDLLDGIELFIPNAVEILDKEPVVLFPQGTSTFDGGKVATFVSYEDPIEGASDLVSRRQKEFNALLKRMSERSAYLLKGDVFPIFRKNVRCNMDSAGLRRLVGLLGDLDADRLVQNRMQGEYRTLENGQRLLFPSGIDANLFKEIVQQNLNALVDASGSGIGERVFSLDVLNGTSTKGLAKRTVTLFESFGYKVLAPKDADRDDYEKTVIYDRILNPDVAKNVGAVIRCENIVQGSPAGTADDYSADFFIVLGKDFNGRYCVP